MQYLAKIQVGNTSFTLPITNDKDTLQKVFEDVKLLAKQLGADLLEVTTTQSIVQELAVVPKPDYQLTDLDQEFVLKLTEVIDESLRDESWIREQIKIWHNDMPEATQCQFFAYYTLWLRVLELRPEVEVIVDIVDGVLQVAKSNADIVFHAIQRDRGEVITADQDALYDRMDHMKGVF